MSGWCMLKSIQVKPENRDASSRAESLVERLRNLHEGPLILHEVIHLGDAAVAPLERLLRGAPDAIYHSRSLAARALAAIGSSEAVAALIRSLLDSVSRELEPSLLEAESVLVNHIAEHLSRFPGPDVTEALVTALRHRRYPGCAAALGLTREPRAIPLLIECLYEDAARPVAVSALRRFGEAATAPLTQALREARVKRDGPEPPSHIDARVASARLLGESCRTDHGGSIAVQALIKALNDKQRAVRIEAAMALAHCGARAAEDAVGTLAVGLDEENWARAEEIIVALVCIGPAAERMLVAMLGLRPRDAWDRRRRLRTVETLGRLGSARAIGRLRQLRESVEPSLRLAAVRALARIPSADADSIALFLGDHDPAVRLRALQAMRRRGMLDPGVTTRLLADEDRQVRKLATEAVRENVDSALPALKEAAWHCGAPLHGVAPRLRLWWHACALIASAARARSVLP